MRHSLVRTVLRRVHASPRIRPTTASPRKHWPSTVVRCRMMSGNATVEQQKPPVTASQPKEEAEAPSPPSDNNNNNNNKNETPPNTVPVTFVEADGTEKCVPATVGHNLLQVAHDHHVELEGACGGELACSTCHLIFPTSIYDTLPPKQDDEEDMLDLAFAVTETSRLGCQVIVREDFANLKVTIPDDGF